MKSKQYSNYFCRSLWLNMNTCSYSPVFISYLSYLFGSIYRHVFRDYIPEIIIHSPAQPFHLQNIGIQIVNQLIGIFVCLCCASPDTKTISSHKLQSVSSHHWSQWFWYSNLLNCSPLAESWFSPLFAYVKPEDIYTSSFVNPFEQSFFYLGACDTSSTSF